MRLPVIKSQNSYKRQIMAFGGLNLTSSFRDGDFCTLYGLTHKEFPYLTQVRQSECDFECTKPTAMICGADVCLTTEDGLYYSGKKVGNLSYGEKNLVQVGSKIIVFPDKVYYDTKEEKFGTMEGKCELGGINITFTENSIAVPENVYETVTVTQSNVYSPEYKVFKYTDVSVENADIIFGTASIVTASQLSPGDIYSETSNKKHYREVTDISLTEKREIIVSGNMVSVKNITKNIFSELRAGDVVEIRGSSIDENNKEAAVTECNGNSLVFADGTFSAGKETSNVIISRKIPNFSCMCAYENRLWGCEGNTIYASKLGDPLNFSVFKGISTDSFAVESSSAEKFTAAVEYGNCCLFFKENKCYKLFGDRPSNFKLTESFGVGISENNVKSIVNVKGALIYKGSGGIYSFYGGFPQLISQKLGDFSANNCVAGSDGEHYYLCGDFEGKREEFIYDTRTGYWSKSGYENIFGYFSKGETLYRLMEDGVYKTTDNINEDIEWVAEFCPFDENYHKIKNYFRIYITAELHKNAWIKVQVSRDGEPWQTVMTKYGEKKEYISIPCPVKSCHELKVRLSGKGRSVIESFTREFSIN